MAEDRFNPLNNADEAQRVAQTATRQTRAVPQEEDPDPAFAEFVSESLRERLNIDVPESEEAEEEAVQATVADPPVAPSPAAPPAPAPGAPVPEPVAPAAPAAPPEPRYAYNGQYYTLEELATQGLLTEALQKAALADRQPAQPEPTPAPLPQMTPQEVQHQMAPVVEQLVSQGWIEEDLPALYPRMTASVVNLYGRLINAERVIGTLLQERQGQLQERQAAAQQQASQATMARLDAAITQTAQGGELYSALNDPATREGFRKYFIDDLNPLPEQITPDFVRRQWFAYNQEVVEQLQRQTQEAAQQRAARPAVLGSPARTARARALPEASAEEWEDLLHDRLR